MLANNLYQKAIASGTYTAGGSWFWLGWRWSATPGVPLRLHAAKKLPTTLFKEPTPYLGALRVAVPLGYSPFNHRGGLCGVSLEELTHGIIFAVADAVGSEAEHADLQEELKRLKKEKAEAAVRPQVIYYCVFIRFFYNAHFV